MQNLNEENEEGVQRVPRNKASKRMQKIVNNRFLNQNIYSMFLQKRYDECLKLIERCSADEFKTYIKSLISKNRYKLQESLSLLNECLIMNKLNYGYLKCIAKNYYLLGKYKSSMEVAKDAYTMNSSDYQIFYIMGKISLALNDKTNAIHNFKHSITKQPNEQSYLQQAKILIKDGQYNTAVDVLKQCIHFSPQNPQAFQILGNCFAKLGKKEQALQYFQLALEKDSMRYHTLMGLGALVQDKGEVQEALEYFTKAYKTSSNSAVLWNNIGVSMTQKKKYIAAYSCFKRALFLDPFRWDTHTNISLILISKKKYLPAQIHLQSALKLKKDGILYNLLGICLSQLKDYNNSIKVFEEGLKHEGENEEIQFNLLMCYIKKNDREKSKQLYAALSRSANSPNVREKVVQVRNMI